MIRVGMFTYSTKPRGSVVHATRLAEALTDAGHDVTLYALGKAGASFYRPLRCPTVIFPAAEAPSDPEALVRQRVDEFVSGLSAGLRTHDIWHAQDCLAASALLTVRASSRPSRERQGVHSAAPIVRTVHHVERFENPYLDACQRRSILEADRVFAVSRRTQSDVLDGFARDASLVSNGVDFERFCAPPGRDRAWLQSRFGVAAGDIVILSVGGVEPRKNTVRLLEAVRRVATVHPNVHWIVVGNSSLWDHSAYGARFEADRAAAPAQVRSRVVLAGALDDDELTALYRLSDVLLCPSEQEGFGLCVLEAMAAGVAVVVPRGEPFDEYLDERAAVFVDPRSAESVAAGLSRLVADPALRTRLATAARARALPFSWRQSAEVHRTHYASLAASWPRGPLGARPPEGGSTHA